MRYWLAALLAACFLPAPASAGQIQFVVAELPRLRFHGDSYIIFIDADDTARLDHARELIEWVASGGAAENSPGATIVVANIKAGQDGINRDTLAERSPLWSWHTVGPIDFADFTIEILDGWPTFVEQDVEGWIANTNGAIGFWSYTIVATASPGTAGDINLDGTVDRTDLAEFAAVFGQRAGGWPSGDFDLDGATTLLDLAQLASHFGTTASPSPSHTAVPEPMGSVVGMGLCLLLFGSRLMNRCVRRL